MPIKDQETWSKIVEKNTDSYGRECVIVARRVMKALDEVDRFDPDDLIHQSEHETKTDRLTPFKEFAVVQAVSNCHSRGEEFRTAWIKP
jgi:hypothetical protein